VWKEKNKYNVLVGKPEGKRSLGRPRHRQEDDIKIDIKELGWGKAWRGLIWLFPLAESWLFKYMCV